MRKIPKATGPRQVVCFYPVELATSEGDVYLFLSKDVYSEFLFQTGIENDNSIASVVKHLSLLMKEENFARFGKAPFTLVMHKHEEHTEKIMDVIRPHGGSVVFDDPYVAQEMTGPMATVYDRLMKGR